MYFYSHFAIHCYAFILLHFLQLFIYFLPFAFSLFPLLYSLCIFSWLVVFVNILVLDSLLLRSHCRNIDWMERLQALLRIVHVEFQIRMIMWLLIILLLLLLMVVVVVRNWACFCSKLLNLWQGVTSFTFIAFILLRWLTLCVWCTNIFYQNS